MADLEDLDARLTAVENRLDDVAEQSRRAREDSAAARVLAGAADRDVSEMRAVLQGHTKVLNALRETQLEHSAKFDRIDAKFSQIDAKFSQIDARFDQIDARFDRTDGELARMRTGFGVLNSGMKRITGMLTELLNREP